MHNLKIRLVSLPLLLCSIGLLAGADRGDLPFDDPDGFFQKRHPPTSINNYGPLTVETSFDELVSNVGLYKSFFEVAVKSGLSYKPLVQAKVLTNEEPVACSSVKLWDEELRAYLDCGDRGFTAKRTTLYKQKPYITAEKMIFTIYPLKTSYVRRGVEELLHQNGIFDANYVDPEYGGGLIEGRVQDVRARGKYFAVMNNSDAVFDSMKSEDPMADFIELFNSSTSEFLFYVELKFQDLSLGDVGLNLDFLLARRKEFPYLTVTHKMATYPLDLFWTYKAKVQQKRKSPDTDAYNTEVSIDSSSPYQPLSFHLEQVVSNEDSVNGAEVMQFANTWMGLNVQADWSPKEFFKHATMYLMDRGTDGKLNPERQFRLHYKDAKDENNTVFLLEIPKATSPQQTKITGPESADLHDRNEL